MGNTLGLKLAELIAKNKKMGEEHDQRVERINEYITKDYKNFKRKREETILQDLFEYGTDVIKARILVMGGCNTVDFDYKELHYSPSPVMYDIDLDSEYLFGNFSTIIDIAHWDDQVIILLERLSPQTMWSELDYFCEKA